MAGKLVQVATETVTSPVASVELTGINTDDVYLFTWVGVTCSNDTQQNAIRITKGGSADTTANYDSATKLLYSSSSFVNNAVSNGTTISNVFQGTGTGEAQNGMMYLYNFNSASEYSYGTIEDVALSYIPRLEGNMGGFVHTVASASDGIQYFMAVGNLTGGTFTLYKVI